MSRLHMVDPKSESGPGADILNGPLKSKQINIFRGLATNPGVLKAFLAYMQGIKAGALTEAEHEVIALVTARKNDCEYCTAAHTQIALGTGLSEDEVTDIRRGHGADDKQQALIDFTAVAIETNGNVTDAQLKSFRSAGYDDAAVIEALASISVTYFTNLFNHVNRTEVDFPEPVAV